jgi:hypothetical protein
LRVLEVYKALWVRVAYKDCAEYKEFLEIQDYWVPVDPEGSKEQL